MEIKVASGKDLKRTKAFIGYDPRTKTNHPFPQAPSEEQGGNSQATGGAEGKESKQETKE